MLHSAGVEETPEWPPIYLAWRQKVAAYWSIAWPSGVVSSVLIYLLTLSWSADAPIVVFQLAGILAYFLYLIAQAFFVRRLVRKRYRSFRIEVARKGANCEPELSMAEIMKIWFQLAWPQAALYFLVAAIAVWFSARNPQGAFGGSGLFLPLNMLVVGPTAAGHAIRKHYPGFHLLAYGQKFV